ncbi:MAG TPA: hypothetical protein VNW92_17295 [Polyangiaceae bacterium]|nr:hypothetical protein [Polyangiaceae bacterium]
MKTPKPGDRIDLSSDSKPVDQPNAAQPQGEGKPPEPNRVGDTTPRKPRFNLEALRLSQNFAETAGVEKRGAMRLGKPPKHSFFRVHAGLTFLTRLLEFGESKDTYLVAAELCDSLASLLRLVDLRVYVTLDGVVGVWPLAIPDPLRPNRWHTSALEIAHAAETRWIRMAANQAVGAYDYVIALGDLKDPSWPTTSLEDIIREAFKDRFIEQTDHPVLRALRGEL